MATLGWTTTPSGLPGRDGDLRREKGTTLYCVTVTTKGDDEVSNKLDCFGLVPHIGI